MKVLVTGAAGRLGGWVVRKLHDAGHDVIATDRVYDARSPVRQQVADLLDHTVAYGLLDGCDALVHLGNHPNPLSRRPEQLLLVENTAMNANVFCAAREIGIERIVFASSVQVVSQSGDYRGKGTREETACRFAYLPADGELPRRPGSNLYAMSKEVAERMLEEFCGDRPQLAATSLRFPHIMQPEWVEHWARRRKTRSLLYYISREAFIYIRVEDAAELVRCCVERQTPGYHQYLPGQTMRFTNTTPQELIDLTLSHVPLKVPKEDVEDLIDISRITADVGWRPELPNVEMAITNDEIASPA